QRLSLGSLIPFDDAIKYDQIIVIFVTLEEELSYRMHSYIKDLGANISGLPNITVMTGKIHEGKFDLIIDTPEK
ncbi:MAG TPA: hypothetical protein VGE07_10595, partial [Herpetosiphonaceae bacterium]